MLETSPLGAVSEVAGDKVSFFLSKNTLLTFGQIVRIESSDRCFYARVVDAKAGSTLAPHEQLREAEGRETFGPYSSFRLVEAVLFLEKKNGKIRSPTFNPNYMDKVFAATSEDCSTLRLQGELEIGRLRTGERLLDSVGIDIDAIPRMMGMFGMTGSGKTNCELYLNAQIIDNSPRTVGLIFDFAGQLLEGKGISPQRGLRDHPLFHTKVRYYSARNGKLKIGTYTLQPAKLQTIFPEIGQPQIRVANKLFEHFGKAWVEKALEAYANNGYAGVAGLINYRNKSVIEALMIRLSSLSRDMFPPSEYNFIDEVVENVSKGITCLVDVSGISSEEQRAIACFAAEAVAQYYKRMWEQNYEEWQKFPTLLITLEEAHEFLDPTKPGTIFSDIALTYRKYRVGLNAVTPRPSRITFDVFAELWTKIIMKTQLSRDRAYLTANTPYLEYSDTEIKMLDVGEALVISEPKTRFAVPVKVTYYPEYLDTRKEVDYNLPESPTLTSVNEKLKKLRATEDVSEKH
jgi:hypothetical protein